jgi:hypothetical protein
VWTFTGSRPLTTLQRMAGRRVELQQRDSAGNRKAYRSGRLRRTRVPRVRGADPRRYPRPDDPRVRPGKQRTPVSPTRRRGPVRALRKAGGHHQCVVRRAGLATPAGADGPDRERDGRRDGLRLHQGVRACDAGQLPDAEPSSEDRQRKLALGLASVLVNTSYSGQRMTGPSRRAAASEPRPLGAHRAKAAPPRPQSPVRRTLPRPLERTEAPRVCPGGECPALLPRDREQGRQALRPLPSTSSRLDLPQLRRRSRIESPGSKLPQSCGYSG